MGEVVEIFLIDEGNHYDITHPMHLHGYSFYVVAMERHGKKNKNVGIASGTEGKYTIAPEIAKTLNKNNLCRAI